MSILMQMAVPAGRRMLMKRPLLWYAMVAIIGAAVLYGLLALLTRRCCSPRTAHSLDSGESGGAHHRPLTYMAPDFDRCASLAEEGDEDMEEFCCEMPPHSQSGFMTAEAKLADKSRHLEDTLAPLAVHADEIIPAGRPPKPNYAFEACDGTPALAPSAALGASFPPEIMVARSESCNRQADRWVAPHNTQSAGEIKPQRKYVFAPHDDGLDGESRVTVDSRAVSDHVPPTHHAPATLESARSPQRDLSGSAAAAAEHCGVDRRAAPGDHREIKRSAPTAVGMPTAVRSAVQRQQRLEYSDPISEVAVIPSEGHSSGRHQRATKYTLPASAAEPLRLVVGKKVQHRKDGRGIERAVSLPKTSIGCF